MQKRAGSKTKRKGSGTHLDFQEKTPLWVLQGWGWGEIQAETDSGKKKDREPLDNFKYGEEKARQMSTQMSEDYQTPPEEI